MAKKPCEFPTAVLSFRRFLQRRFLGGRHHHRPTSTTATGAAIPPADKLHNQTVMIDLESWLLRVAHVDLPLLHDRRHRGR
ncbi:hypothetical protein EE612_028336 [Oryza sativa]|nr:hypothetical protein EE612_028336 [Oryza sativa]